MLEKLTYQQLLTLAYAVGEQLADEKDLKNIEILQKIYQEISDEHHSRIKKPRPFNRCIVQQSHLMGGAGPVHPHRNG